MTDVRIILLTGSFRNFYGKYLAFIDEKYYLAYDVWHSSAVSAVEVSAFSSSDKIVMRNVKISL
jgi:hypothetical protein